MITSYKSYSGNNISSAWNSDDTIFIKKGENKITIIPSQIKDILDLSCNFTNSQKKTAPIVIAKGINKISLSYNVWDKILSSSLLIRDQVRFDEKKEVDI